MNKINEKEISINDVELIMKNNYNHFSNIEK